MVKEVLIAHRRLTSAPPVIQRSHTYSALPPILVSDPSWNQQLICKKIKIRIDLFSSVQHKYQQIQKTQTREHQWN